MLGRDIENGSRERQTMGHRIDAVLLRGPYEEEKARAFDLKPILLTSEITLFPLDASYCDYWAENLKIGGWVDDGVTLNMRVVHHMIRSIAWEPIFAVIQTNYFGGRGSQSAAAYCGTAELMAPETGSFGPINKALRHLGVQAAGDKDEFDTVGLSDHRGWKWELFRSYDEGRGPDQPATGSSGTG